VSDFGLVVIGGGEAVESDRIMIGVGRRPNTDGLNLAAAGVPVGPRGEIQVNEYMETSVPGIFAAGDVLARFMLSSVAVVEARIAAENAMGRTVTMDYACAPWGIYTDPEAGSVGLTEEGARAEDIKDMVYNHPTVSEDFGKAAADALKKFEQRTPA